MDKSEVYMNFGEALEQYVQAILMLNNDDEDKYAKYLKADALDHLLWYVKNGKD